MANPHILTKRNRFNHNEITVKIESSINEQNKKIVLIWIPGHINIQDNETLDKASKQIAKTNQEKIQIKTYTDIKKQIKNIRI